MRRAPGPRRAARVVLALCPLWLGCGPSEAGSGGGSDAGDGQAAAGSAVGGEGVSETELEITARFPRPFAMVETVAERSDATVLVADPLEGTLQLVDFAAGTATVVGGEGQGPDEYRQPDAVWGLPGDSVLLVDLGNARITLIGPDLAFLRTWPMSVGDPRSDAQFETRIPVGVDADGGVYYRGRTMSRAGPPPTHAPVRRWDRGTDQVTDVTELLLPGRTVRRSGSGSEQNVSMRAVPLSPSDDFAVGADGRVAVARAVPYRLEWIDRDGTALPGPEIEYEPVPVRTADQEAWIEQRQSGIAISVEVGDAGARTSFSRAGFSSRAQIAEYDWPDHKPAFVSSGVSVASDGRAWVERSVPAGEPVVYDVFGSRGERERTVRLDADQRVVGFGEGSVYLVRTDDVGLQTLERARLPGA